MEPVGTGDWGLGLGLDNYIMNKHLCAFPVLHVSLGGYHFIPWEWEREWLMVSRDCKIPPPDHLGCRPSVEVDGVEDR